MERPQLQHNSKTVYEKQLEVYANYLEIQVAELTKHYTSARKQVEGLENQLREALAR